MAPARLRVLLRQADRDSAVASKISASLGYRDLNIESRDLFGDSARGSLFILGSGSSINNLSAENFNTVARGVSIGINVWAVHPFVPDVYSFESASQLDGISGEVEFLEERLTRPEVMAKRPRFVLLRQRIAPGETQIIRFPPELREGVFVYGRANLVTRLEKNLRRDLALAMDAFSAERMPSNVLLDNGASVVRLITLGLLQGFKEIILVGVDLDERPYFWLAENYAFPDPQLARFFPRRSGLPHDTLETTSRPFPVDTVILALAHIAEAKFGSKIVVGSADSLLADQLSVFDWKRMLP